MLFKRPADTILTAENRRVQRRGVLSEDRIQQRKADHLRIVAEGSAGFVRPTLLDCVDLTHNALPELDLESLDTTTGFFSKTLTLPLMITSMTGGAAKAGELNRNLALVAGKAGIAFATGSQRIILTHPETIDDFNVRKQIPDGVLLGNLGGQQLLDNPIDAVVNLVNRIDADGLCVHLNPAHELAQPEGDRKFCGILDGIRAINEKLEGRVLVKEVGHGLSQSVVEQLLAAGVRYLDVAGAGGTSWTRVEALRPDNENSIGSTFAEWGIATATAVARADLIRQPDTVLVASGGIRSGLDMGRAIALGADVCGIAQPALAAYLSNGVQGVKSLIERLSQELKTTMLLTACKIPAQLKNCDRVINEPLAQQLVVKQLWVR